MLPERSKPSTNTTEPPTDSCVSGSDVATCAAEQNNGAVFRVKLVAEINGNVNAVSTTSDSGPASGTRKRDSDTVDENAASTSKRCRTNSADDPITNSLNNAEDSLNNVQGDANVDEDAATSSEVCHNNVEEDANVDEDAATSSEVCHTSGVDEQIEAEVSLNVIEEDANVGAASVEGAEEEEEDNKQNIQVDCLTVRESVTVSVSVEKSTVNIKTECEDADDEPKPSSSYTSSSSNIKPEVKPAAVLPAIKVEKADASSTSRESCKFGIRCYRRNPMHRIEEAHPGDHDYKRPSYPPPPDDTPDCPYGDSCYRRNPVHFQQYKHPPDSESFALSSASSMAAAQKRMLAKLQGGNNTENAAKAAVHSTAQSTIQQKTIAQGTGHPCTEKCTMCNCGAMQKVLERLSDIEAAISKLDQKVDTLSKDVIGKKEFALQNKIIRDNLLITKRMGLTTQRVFGHTKTGIDIEVASCLPLSTIGDVRDLEEKLEQDEYMCALKLHLFALKGPNGTVDVLFRKVIGDQCVANFNWDGRYRRMALQATKIFSSAFIETFPEMTRMEVEKSIRKSVERAHNRLKQFNFKYRKATILNTEA